MRAALCWSVSLAGLIAAVPSLAVAQTPTVATMGLLRNSPSPWQVCAFDSDNICQAFLNLPATGGGAVVPVTHGGTGLLTGTANGLPYFATTTTMASTAAGNNGVLVTGAGGVPTISTTLPDGLALGTPASATLTHATGLPISTGVAGLGTGIATALGVNVGTAGAPVINGGALGTPSSGTATNLTGTAAGLTAGHVTTNANLTGPITSTGNATSIASQTGTGSTFVMSASPTITGAFTATGLVTNADLVNAATTVNGQVCTLGLTCTVTASASAIAPGTTTIVPSTNGGVLYDNAGVVGDSKTLPSGLTYPSPTFTGSAPIASGFAGSNPGVDTAVVLDYFQANINSYLTAWEYGGALGFEAPNAQSLVGKIFCSPSWSANMGANPFTGCFGVAGYAIASNNGVYTTAGVGGYFQGSLYNPAAFDLTHPGQAWGLNSLVTNFPGQAGGGSIGSLYSNIYSIEADVNLQPATTGATSLNGNARGIYITGTLDAQAGNMPGVEVDHNGTYPWKIGFLTDTGAATLGISLGAVAAGASQSSQALQFRSTDSGSATVSASIVEDQSGILFLNPGPGSIVAATNGSGTTIAKFSATEATLSGVLGITPATWADNHTCIAGQISVDADYIYVCTASNTVKRAAITAF